MVYLKKAEIVKLLKINNKNVNESLKIDQLKQQLNDYLNKIDYKKSGRGNYSELKAHLKQIYQYNSSIINQRLHLKQDQYDQDLQEYRREQLQQQADNYYDEIDEQNRQLHQDLTHYHSNQYEQDLQEYRREQLQQQADNYYDEIDEQNRQLHQDLTHYHSNQYEQDLQEYRQQQEQQQANDFWTNYIIEEQEQARRILEQEQEANLQYQIMAQQNKEIKDKINQYDGKNVNQIDNDAGVILYFQPVNMEQFIDTVDSARTGFNRERTINQRDEQGQLSQLHYNNVIQSLADIEMFVNEIYEAQHHQAFKIQFNFGVIYEEYRHDQNDQVQVDYGYILPRDTRIQEHSPKVIQNQDDIEEYQQYIKAEIINMQNFTLESTRQRYIAIYSMLIKTYNLQPQIVGASMKELIDLHCNGRKNVIYKNTGNNNNCYMEAVAKALHPDSKEKRYFPYEIISISKQLLVQILELPFDSKSRKMTDLLKVFDGLDITKYAQIVSQKLKINQDIYYYDNEHKNYYRGLQIMYQCEQIEDCCEINQNEQPRTIDILVVESEWEGNKISHAFAIANKQALTGLQFCPHCNSKAFDPKDKNYSRDYEKHIVKCENNGGKIIKKVKLDYVQKPYCPHIMHNKTYQYLLANGRENEYKPTQYFITYDLETVPKIVNKKLGKSSYQMYELFPLSVASTIRNKQGIKKIFFSQQNGQNFIVQWLNQLFKEAEQVNADNQYLTAAGTVDEKIPYSIEVPIVGFNSSRFDISLIISYMQCKDWTITNYTGSPSTAKLIIVHHKKLNLQVKFVDMLTYLQPMELKQAAKDFGDGYDDKKGLFPYECFNTDNVNEILSKSEPFSMEDFNSSLKKTKISQKDYQIYLDDAKRFKNRWDYLQFYNEQDTYIMVKPLMTLISLQFKYKIDMFSFMSMAACSNAIKYAKAYEDFDINGVYPNFDDNSQKFHLNEQYWQSKVKGYIQQDKHKKRDIKNNVKDSDYEYFKRLFNNSNCSICGCKFTVNNKPTLDRIDNSKSHSIDNVQPCCLYCNCFCSDKDKNIGKLFIQLRKYCMIRCLPTNLTDIDVYHLVRKWITGGLSNVMHRVNRSGIDFIKRIQYDKDNKKVTVITTDHRITHVVGVGFNSLYPSVMSSEPHQFINYTNGKMYMCGSQTGKIIGDTDHSKQTIQRIINSKKRFTENGQLFIAEVKGHIDQNYINDFNNFPPILRNYEFTTDERTIGSYMYNHMRNNNVKTDQKQRKLTNLTSTMGEYMAFSSYYLWFLIDDCHFIIDDVKQIVLFNKHNQFNSFIKEFTKNRIEAKLDENKGQEQFFKIVMNSSYGSDGMNTEKYHKVKIMNKKQTERAIRSNAFMDEQQISEDSYLVQMNPEHCSCKTPLQVAFFVLDNAKYWYLNFIYNFMYKCLDMNRIHFIEGDTDSAYWAISGNVNEDFTQQFNAVINDREFYNDNAKYYFPTIRGDIYDEKKILGLAIERQGISMIALAPKNYMIETNYNGNSKIKLKGVNQKTNKITKAQIIDCINEGKITKCTNMRLGQKNHQMSQLSIEKNGITGIHTKAIVLSDQSCCPYIFGLTAKDYSFQDN